MSTCGCTGTESVGGFEVTGWLQGRLRVWHLFHNASGGFVRDGGLFAQLGRELFHLGEVGNNRRQGKSQVKTTDSEMCWRDVLEIARWRRGAARANVGECDVWLGVTMHV